MSKSPPSGLTLLLTFVALVVLAAVSWLLSAAGTGTAVALAIASVKALLIALFFMELIVGHATDRTVACIAVLFVVLLTVGMLADVAYR
jgi:caa(3)-type oxidase subunit IV